MTIRNSLILTFVLIGMVLSILSVLLIAYLQRGVDRVGDSHAPALAEIKGVESGLNSAVQESFAFVLSGLEEEREDFLAALSQVDDHLGRFVAATDLGAEGQAEQTRLFRRVVAGHGRLEPAAREVFDAWSSDAADRPEVFERYEAIVDSTLNDVSLLVELVQEEVRLAQADMRRTVRLTLASLYGLAAMAFVLAVGVGTLVSARLTRPLARLRHAATRIGEGEIDRVEVQGAREIATLARAFNEMADQVHGARQSLEAAVEERTAELRTANLALRESGQLFRTMIEHAPEAITVLDVDQQRFVDVNENAVRLFGYDRAWLKQLTPVDISPERQPDGRSSAEAAEEYLGRALDGETPIFEWTHRDAHGREVPCETRFVRLPVSDARLVRGSITDISARKDAERRDQLMLRELDHRVKNNLAAVLAVCEQTIRRSRTKEELGVAIRGRIHAMARTHEALARGSWCGLELGEAVQAALAPYAETNDRITVRGDRLVLTSRVASPFSLAIHELATNAAKHGALSSLDGRVDVKWSMSSRQVDLEWIESGGPAVREPKQGGYGLEILHGLVEAEIGGRLDIRFEPPGLRCRLTLPLPGERAE